MSLSRCDKCRQEFDEDMDEMIYCDKCDDYLCTACYKDHHNNINQLIFVYVVGINVNKYCKTSIHFFNEMVT